MTPDEHKHYLKKRFSIKCFRYASPKFSFAQNVALHRYGEWMLALETGAIAPITADQEHFIKVCRDELEPVTPLEKTWIRYKRHCAYEDAEEEGRHQHDIELRRERRQLLHWLENCDSHENFAPELHRLEEIDEDFKIIEGVRSHFVSVCSVFDDDTESASLSKSRLLEMLVAQFDKSRLERLSRFCPGVTVRHPKLGLGKVVKIDSENDTLLLCVQFSQTKRSKWLMEEYAELEIVLESIEDGNVG